MKSVRTRFVIAISITLMNIWVTLHYGPLLWEVWGGIPPARVGLLLFAGVGAFTLMDIWAQTVGLLSSRWPSPVLNGRDVGLGNSKGNLEGGDV